MRALIAAIAFFLLTIAVFNSSVFAQAPACQGFDCLEEIKNPDLTVESEVGLPAKIISVFLPAILGIAGFITVIIIIIAGIGFITSRGDPKGAEAAKGRLTYALIGFIILILAFAILQIINSIFLGRGLA